MEASKEENEVRKQQPFDFGIKSLKKQLAAGGMSKRDINKTVKMYKERLYTRVAEVREKMEKELLEKNNAANK